MDESRYRIRLYLLTAAVLVGFGVLLTRLHMFQIQRRDEFLQQVPGNRMVTIREPGVRGEIHDRNGIVLARNKRDYEISFNLEEIHKAYLDQHISDPRRNILRRENGMDRKRSVKDILGIVTESITQPLQRLKLYKKFSGKALEVHYTTHGGLVPFSYRNDLTYDEFARFAEHNVELPGVDLALRPQREYPYGALASHILGYLKQWEQGDISEADQRIYDHYIGEPKGIAGVEATMDKYLRGPEGRKSLIKDEKNHIIGMDDYRRPGVGARVDLTIDARVQYLVENVLRKVGRAAAVVMDVHTGEVIAMASVPDYDPNAFIPSIAAARYAEYRKNKSSPFTNRCISSFTPGSTFKLPTAISGALKGMARRSFTCNGFVTYGNHNIGCWIWNKSHGSHGLLDLPHAIKNSCNPYFNQLANSIDTNSLVEGFQMAGLGLKTGIPLPGESPGTVMGSKSWRASHQGVVMTPVKKAFLSIGQDESAATPLQLASMVACIANGGTYYQPRVIKRVVNEDGSVAIPDIPVEKVNLIKEGLKREDLEIIRKGMWLAVNEQGGTANLVKMPGVEIGGKTGTAQTIDHGQKSHNAWTLAFAPFKEPKYAVCVLVQNGNSGGHVCGPLVHLILRGIFARDEGMRLPLQAQTEFKGNTDAIESVPLPPDILASMDVTAADDTGDAGNEAGDEAAGTTSIDSGMPEETPTPTITPELDDEGSVIPRAKPVQNQ